MIDKIKRFMERNPTINCNNCFYLEHDVLHFGVRRCLFLGVVVCSYEMCSNFEPKKVEGSE